MRSAKVGNRWVYAAQNSATAWVLNHSDGSDASTAYGFPLSGVPKAFCETDSAFASVNSAGVLTFYTGWTWTDAKNTIYAGYTWYDSGARNGVWHETSLGMVGKMTAVKRSKVRITVPAVPDKGGVDDPDKFRLYVARAATDPGPGGMPRQFEGGSATVPTQVTITGDPSGTNFPPPTPNPNDFPGGSPAQLYSGQFDSAGRRKFLVDGFGQGRWTRDQPVGSIREWSGASSTPPEGWLFCDVLAAGSTTLGQAVSRTAYPELAAQYWNGSAYVYGNGDGSTTFNLPYRPVEDEEVTGAPLSPAAGFSIATQEGIAKGKWRLLRANITRTGATIASAANGDIADVAIGTLATGWATAMAQSPLINASGQQGLVIVTNTGDVTLTGLAPGQAWATGDIGRWNGLWLAPNVIVTPKIRKIIYAGEGS